MFKIKSAQMVREVASKTSDIAVEGAKSIDTTLDVVEGMQFGIGHLSPYMCTDMESMEVILEDPYILIFKKNGGMGGMM